jgi:uncharacterized membrane protein
MEIALTLLLLLFVPTILKVFEKTKFVNTISPIALSYAAGIGLSFVSIPLHHETLLQTTEISIALSISLLVLASNLSKFRVLLKPVLKAFFLGILSLFIAIILVYFLIEISYDQRAQIMGMLTGVYVGGTPNLNAIGLALEVPNDIIVLVNTAEMVFGGIYFLLLITVIKPFLSLFLRKYVPKGLQPEEEEALEDNEKLSEYVKMTGLSLLSAIAVLGISFGLVLLLFGKVQVAALLIILTTLSLIGGQLNFIKIIKWKFETADFLLLIFSFGIGLQIDIDSLLSQGLDIYGLVGAVFIGTILIHYFLAWITRTDVDTLMISATAALYGPAFIAPIAKAINNRELIIYGIALGLLGYILGNYLGLSIAWLLGMMSSVF